MLSETWIEATNILVGGGRPSGTGAKSWDESFTFRLFTTAAPVILTPEEKRGFETFF